MVIAIPIPPSNVMRSWFSCHKSPTHWSAFGPKRTNYFATDFKLSTMSFQEETIFALVFNAV